MKNSEIHHGLEKSEIRDFLSIGLLKLNKEESENQKENVLLKHNILLDRDDSFEWCINDAKAQIIFLEKYIRINRSRQAIITLIKMNGWEEFDVSDLTTETDTMCFIGTAEEYNKLLSKIEDLYS